MIIDGVWEIALLPRHTPTLFALALLLGLTLQQPVSAIDTMHGGFYYEPQLITGNFTIWVANGHAAPEDLEYADLAAAAGIKVYWVTHWWDAVLNNPLDILYNNTYKEWFEQAIKFELNLGPAPVYQDPEQSPPERLMNIGSVSGVALGDEEPAWFRYADIW